MMDILERPRTVLEHRPRANHYDTLERDRMATEKPTQSTPERWLPVPGYEGVYEVSDHGSIRSLDRIVYAGQGRTRRSAGRVLAPYAAKSGHLSVNLKKNCEGGTKQVHQLVLAAFVGPCPDGMEVCHNNGDAADNRLPNLRYDTRKSNVADTLRHGTHPMASKTHCPHGHEYTPENTYIIPGSGGRVCRTCTRDKSRPVPLEKRKTVPITDEIRSLVNFFVGARSFRESGRDLGVKHSSLSRWAKDGATIPRVHLETIQNRLRMSA